MNYNETIQEILEYVNKHLKEDFDFTIEHWENGNFDDSYGYGVESGEQFALRKIKSIIEKGD